MAWPAAPAKPPQAGGQVAVALVNNYMDADRLPSETPRSSYAGARGPILPETQARQGGRPDWNCRLDIALPKPSGKRQTQSQDCRTMAQPGTET